MRTQKFLSVALLQSVSILLHASPLHAQGVEPADVTYADLADLADAADLVARVQVVRMAQVEPERAPGVSSGFGRFYIEAHTKALLTAKAPLGEKVQYLVDLDVTANNRPSKLKRRDVFVFARRVSGQSSALQLVAPDAQLLWSAEREGRLRSILQALRSSEAPPKIIGVRELQNVPGNLEGEGRTQIFLRTQDRSGASITVKRYPGMAPTWGVSFSELVAGFSPPPAPDTIAWYRLACFLPSQLPAGIDRSESEAARRQAAADYRLVLNGLGPCPRARRVPGDAISPAAESSAPLAGQVTERLSLSA